MEAYRKVNEIEPENIDAWINKERILLSMGGEYKGYSEAREKIITIEPKKK